MIGSKQDTTQNVTEQSRHSPYAHGAFDFTRETNNKKGNYWRGLWKHMPGMDTFFPS